MINNSPFLPLARYRMVFRALDPLRFPAYPGAMWRGAFGRALKQTVCVVRGGDCGACLLQGSCPYPTFFDEAPGGTFNAPPRPCVLEPLAPPGELGPGAPVAVQVVLFGHANRLLPYVVHAFGQAGSDGLGKDRGRLALDEVHQEGEGAWQSILEADDGRLAPLPAGAPEPPPVPERVRLTLHTPLRLKRDGRLLTPERFRFDDLLRNLLRRQRLLARFYGDAEGDPEPPTLRGDPLLSADLHWHDWTRWSARQRTEMKLGGLLGHLDLDGPALTPVWADLWRGQWLHAGNGSMFGLGWYGLEEG